MKKLTGGSRDSVFARQVEEVGEHTTNRIDSVVSERRRSRPSYR